MALFNKSYVLSKATSILRENYSYNFSSESEVINSTCKSLSQKADKTKLFDIFLSHSYTNRKGAIGIKAILEKEFNYSFYIDWIIDNDLSRSNVSAATAKRIKERMNQCLCLFYVTSADAPVSKWMPWETGLMDGLTNKVAICPFVDNSNTNIFQGQELSVVYKSCRIYPFQIISLSNKSNYLIIIQI